MFSRLAEAVEEVRGMHPVDFTDEELGDALVELQRLRAKLESAETRLKEGPIPTAPRTRPPPTTTPGPCICPRASGAAGSATSA